MTAATAPTITEAPAATSGRTRTFTRTLPRTTVLVGLGAAVVVTGLAAAADVAGVPLAIDGEVIPIAGFAQMTFLGAVLGGVMVALFNRFSAASRRRFVQTAVALTTLSCVPSVMLPPDTATRIVLVATHVVAAAIIVPVLARSAHD